MQYNKITKENIDHLLFEVAKEYHKHGKKAKGEIVIVGGAAIIANYEFRSMSEDADAIMFAESHLKDAIVNVARKNNLPDNWLNSDFKVTRSYSDKLGKYAKDYKKYANCIEVKVIDREYLIAMKLASFRKYRNDISDIIGILNSNYDKDMEITFEEIQKAIINLYGSYDYIEKEARQFIENSMKEHNYRNAYDVVLKEEKMNRNIVSASKNEILNIKDINYVLSKTKNKRLNDLYIKLGITPTNDMHKNATLANDLLFQTYSDNKKTIDFSQYVKTYFDDLYNLHLQYLNKEKDD